MILVQEMFGKQKKMNSKLFNCLVFFALALTTANTVKAQDLPVDRCGAMTVLNQELARNPALKDSMNAIRTLIKQAVKNRLTNPSNARTEATTIYVPVVFHVVMTDPSIVTDAQLNAQIDVLNKDYAGLNADSTKIPSYFKSLYGHSRIQFVLAKRNASNAPSTGIERVTTTQTVFYQADNYVKHTNNGGANAWDQTRFFNVWVCNLQSGLLGYATFPGQTPLNEQGVVMSYGCVPGGAFAGYNQGRTLTHESGHYFSLYHIWGDDNGSCAGSDDIDDTPNQSDATSGCPTGVQTDNCSTVAPGYMYQNYMDYSSDGCMVMFTNDQMAVAEATLTGARSGLVASNATVSPLKKLDAMMVSVDQPYNRICDTKFTPVITFSNYGTDSLKSLDIYASVDGGTAVLTHWTGSLASLYTAQVTLPVAAITGGNGAHKIKIQLSNPNGGTDLGTANDTLTYSFLYPAPTSAPITEGFESTFPSNGWDIVNADKSYTWEKTTAAAKTGTASMVARNFNYTTIGQRDYLRLPLVALTNADSAFLTFQVAYAAKTATTLFHDWDTLQVMASTDCGATFTTLYKKWGATLATHSGATTTSFVPAANEWRKDSVNLTKYINKGAVLLAFVNSSGNENNLYVDDINLYQKGTNTGLTNVGWQITPNPTTGLLTVQFAATPVNLKGIAVYSITGQQLAERLVSNNNAATAYAFDLDRYASGVYVVRIVFSDHVVSRKIVKE